MTVKPHSQQPVLLSCAGAFPPADDHDVLGTLKRSEPLLCTCTVSFMVILKVNQSADNTPERGHHSRQASKSVEKYELSRISPQLDSEVTLHTTGFDPMRLSLNDNGFSSINPTLRQLWLYVVHTRMQRCQCSEDRQRAFQQLSAKHWWLSWVRSACEQRL